MIPSSLKLRLMRNAAMIAAYVAVAVLLLGIYLMVQGNSLGFILIGLVVFGGFYAAAEFLEFGEKSGREKYEASLTDRMMGTRSSDDPSSVPVDDLTKKDPDAPAHPRLDLDTSMIALGQSGRGKSTFAKSVIQNWDHERQGMIFHALSDGPKSNEFEEFAAAIAPAGADVIRLSTADPDVRWDVFADFGMGMAEMSNIAEGMWAAYETEKTGYDESAKALLKCAIAVCSASSEYEDFGQLDNVLTENTPEEIVSEAKKLPRSQVVTAGLESSSDLDTVYSILMGNLQNLLLSDLFDESLPTFSITEYYENPTDYVVIDNIRSDDWAAPFWRFFLSTAIQKSMELRNKQFFVLDEVDKLPRIDDLDKLASAGRSANAQGVVIAQDIHQIREIYGQNKLNTIFGNSPNRAVFQPGDPDTAEYVMESLGKAEVTEESISSSVTGKGGVNPSVNRSKSRREKYPLTENELMSMGVGEALIVSPEGWWQVKVSEPDIPEPDRPALEDPEADPEPLAEPNEMWEDNDDEGEKSVEEMRDEMPDLK